MMEHQVFISYFRGEEQGGEVTPDRRAADQICTALEKRDIPCFIDHRDILPGVKNWQTPISKAISNCRILIFVCSGQSQASKYVRREVHLADKKDKIIITFRIDNTDFNEGFDLILSEAQGINANTGDFRGSLDRLVDAVAAHLGKPVAEGPEVEIPVKKEAKPADEHMLEKLGYPVKKNDRGFWEADFGGGIVMVQIPKGKFTMGSDTGEDKEKPCREVYLDTYWLGKTGVTVEQFGIFCKETEYRTQAEKEEGTYIYLDREWKKKKEANWRNPNFGQTAKNPVVCVSWNDVTAYCEWLSKKTGMKFHLPSEAQWEKGVRGSDGRTYPWGSSEPAKGQLNFDKNVGQTSPVGSYPADVSPYGLLDMAGNVREWCGDWYREDYYKDSPTKNPTGSPAGSFRVIRGGSWYRSADYCRASIRRYGGPDLRVAELGIRLALSF